MIHNEDAPTRSGQNAGTGARTGRRGYSALRNQGQRAPVAASPPSIPSHPPSRNAPGVPPARSWNSPELPRSPLEHPEHSRNPLLTPSGVRPETPAGTPAITPSAPLPFSSTPEVAAIRTSSARIAAPGGRASTLLPSLHPPLPLLALVPLVPSPFLALSPVNSLSSTRSHRPTCPCLSHHRCQIRFDRPFLRAIECWPDRQDVRCFFPRVKCKSPPNSIPRPHQATHPPWVPSSVYLSC